MKPFQLPGMVLFSIILLCIATVSCSHRGLLTEQHSYEIYNAPKLMTDGPHPQNPIFLVYGDIRPGHRIVEKFGRKENWRTWKMAIVPFYQLYWFGNGFIGAIDMFRRDSGYGSNERRMVREAVYSESKQIPVDFILNTGDFVTDGRYPDHWLRFIRENKIEHPLLTEVPFLPVIGSHEYTNDTEYGLKNFKAVFQYPRFYVLEFPDADLFVIDSNIILDQKQHIDDETQNDLFGKWFVSPKGSTTPAWLEKKLAASTKTFKIVSMHHTPISFGHHHHDWSNKSYGKDLPEKRKRLLGLFRKYGVQIVFCGHEHLYEHNILQYKKNDRGSPRELHVIVTGGGGVPLRRKSDQDTIKKYLDYYEKEGLDIIPEKNEKIYHFCLVSIYSGQVTIDVKEVTGDPEIPLKLIESIVIRDK